MHKNFLTNNLIFKRRNFVSPPPRYNTLSYLNLNIKRNTQILYERNYLHKKTLILNYKKKNLILNLNIHVFILKASTKPLFTYTLLIGGVSLVCIPLLERGEIKKKLILKNQTKTIFRAAEMHG